MGNSVSSPPRRVNASTFSYRQELDDKDTDTGLKHDYSAPPSYAASTTTCLLPPQQACSTNTEISENALETLRKYDTVIIVDDSASMREHWKQTRKALSALVATAAKYDANGLDIYFLNDERRGLNLKSSEDVILLFNTVRPSGCTPIGHRLDVLLHDYIRELDNASDPRSVKPINYLIITDGAPTDDPLSVIVSVAQLLDSRHRPLSQVGLQFVQIGENRGAAQFLQELDDDLGSKYQCRDMVDTTPTSSYSMRAFDTEVLTKALLGGINRRVDKQSCSAPRRNLQ